MSSFEVLEGLLLGIVPLHSKFTATPKTFNVSILKSALQIRKQNLMQRNQWLFCNSKNHTILNTPHCTVILD